MKKIFKSIYFVFALVSIFALAGCGKSDMTEITIAEVTHSVFYAPQYVALEEGYFEDEGIDASLLLTQGADKTMAALLSDEAQIGLMGPEATVYVYNQGSKDYAINFAQLTKRDGTFLLGRSENEIFDFEALKGKVVIGGRKGGMPEMTLEYVLKKNGLTLGEDIAAGETFVRTDVQFAAMSGAFIGGEGDYVALFEPSATQVEKQGEGYIIANMGQLSGEIPYTAYSALGSYIDDNPETIQKFTDAVYKGQQYVNTHSAEEIADIIEPQFTEMTKEDLISAIQNYKDTDTWCTEPLLKEEALIKLMDVMEEAGELSSRPDYDAIVNTDFAEEAVK